KTLAWRATRCCLCLGSGEGLSHSLRWTSTLAARSRATPRRSDSLTGLYLPPAPPLRGGSPGSGTHSCASGRGPQTERHSLGAASPLETLLLPAPHGEPRTSSDVPLPGSRHLLGAVGGR